MCCDRAVASALRAIANNGRAQSLRRKWARARLRGTLRSLRGLLWLEVAAARAVGWTVSPGRSWRRHDAARQAALEGSIPAPSIASLRGCRSAARSSRRRTARRRRPRWPARSCRRRSARLQPLGREPPSRASPRPCSAARAPSSGSSRSTRRRCPRSRARTHPRVVCARQPLPRPARPLRRARARRRTAGAHASTGSSDATARRLNADDPLLGELGRARRRQRALLRHRRPAHARGRRCSTPPTRSTACTCGAPLRATPRPTSGTSATIAAPPTVTSSVRRSMSWRARSSCTGSTASSSRCDSRGLARASTLRLPGLYNVYNAAAAAALAPALEVPLDEIAAGLDASSAAFGRFERIVIGDRGVLMLLIKNPAGANEAVANAARRGPPALALVALNDEIADGRDVSWIWDVDFEPLLAGLEHVVVSGDRAAELALRFAYGGLPRPDRGRPRARRGARPRARARRRPAASSSCCRPTRRCSRCAESSPIAGSRRTTGRRRHEDPCRPPLPRLPEHLRRPRQHRRARGARGRAGTRARGRGDRARRRDPRELDLFYIGGGQDRDQQLVAPDLAAKAAALARRRRRRRGRSSAVCGGYQLLGRFYRDRDGTELPGIGLLALHTRRRRAAADRRCAARLRLGRRDACRLREPRRPDATSTPVLEPLGRVVAGFGNDGDSGFEGRTRRAASTGRICTARCCRGTPGSRIGCSRMRSRISPARSTPWRRFRMSSRRRLMPSRQPARAAAADVLGGS